MRENHSETNWLQLLKLSDDDAARRIWQRYFHRLLGLARKRLGTGPNRAADEEDVALSAFDSFCRGAVEGRFAQLDDRDDLWQVLAVITTRKAGRQRQRERALKRGGGRVRGESAIDAGDGSDVFAGIQDVASGGPTPEFMAIVDEEFQRLLDLLPDERLREIALLKLEGHNNAEIAERLGRHVRSVERKLQLIRRHWADRGED